MNRRRFIPLLLLVPLVGTGTAAVLRWWKQSEELVQARREFVEVLRRMAELAHTAEEMNRFNRAYIESVADYLRWQQAANLHAEVSRKISDLNPS